MRYLDKIFDADEISSPLTLVFSQTPVLLLDAYQPKKDTEENRPCIIWLHGGGGIRQDMEGKCMEFAQRGYVTMTIDYRGGEGNFTQEKQAIAISDLWAAIRWVRLHANRLKINPDKIFTGGVSAGALTSLQANITANDTSNPIFQNPDMNTSNGDGPVNILGSATTSGAASGIFFDLINPGDAPNFFYNGELDQLIKFSQAVKTYEKMLEMGIASTMMSFPDSGHKLGSHSAEINTDTAKKFYELL